MAEMNFKFMRNPCFVLVEHKLKKSRGRKSFLKSLQDLRKLKILFYNESLPANNHIALLQAYQEQEAEEIICHGGGYYRTNLDNQEIPKTGVIQRTMLEFYGASDTVGKFDLEVLKTVIDRERIGFEPLSQFAVIRIEGEAYLNTFKHSVIPDKKGFGSNRPVKKAEYTPATQRRILNLK